MTNPIPALREVQASFYRIQSSAAVLAPRLRGDVSLRVVRQIEDDANAGLVALQNLVATMSETPTQQAADISETATGATTAPMDQPDIAGMIRMLLDILSSIDQGSDDSRISRNRCAVETVEALANALGIADQVQPSQPAANEAQPLPFLAEAPAAEENIDEGEGVDLADALSENGVRVTDEDLLDAVRAAVHLIEYRETAIIGLGELDRRLRHGKFLFRQIADTDGWQDVETLAEIGADLMEDAQNDLLSIIHTLSGAEVANHD